MNKKEDYPVKFRCEQETLANAFATAARAAGYKGGFQLILNRIAS